MRTCDAKLLNEVANLPETRPFLGGSGPVDLTAVLLDTNNYAFVNEEGGYIVVRLSVDRYECHTIFRPGSARSALKLMHPAIRYMFTCTPCLEIVSKFPETNVAAHWLGGQAGFTELFKRDNAWEGQKAVSYRVITLDRWLGMCSTTLEAGKTFRKRLDVVKSEQGSSIPSIPEEELHNRWLGWVLETAKEGNVLKGVAAYNRWAAFVGNPQFAVLSEIPPVVDMLDVVVGIEAKGVEILLCRQ